MQTSIAQTVALTMTGNAFLQGWSIERFWPDASVFRYCSSVRFAAQEKTWLGGRTALIAKDPIDWLRALRPDTAGLRLHLLGRNDPGLSDRLSVGIVGGGSRWIIESISKDDTSRFWQENWELGDQSAADQRIWDVTYWRVGDGVVRSDAPSRSEEAVTQDLSAALSAIADFSERNGLGFEQSFCRGVRILRGESAGEGVFHADLAPKGYLSGSAQRLVEACQAAWVFGGMGSWNDGAYDGDLTEEGDRLSEDLFNLLQEGLVVAANSTLNRS